MGTSAAVFLKFVQLNLFKVYLSVFLITSCDNDKAAIAEMNRPGIPAPYLFYSWGSIIGDQADRRSIEIKLKLELHSTKSSKKTYWKATFSLCWKDI